MKKFLSFAAFAMFACALTFVSCGSDDDDDNSNPVTPTAPDDKGGEKANDKDLVGVWELKARNFLTTYTFTAEKLTIVNTHLGPHENTQTIFDGPYTLKDGVLSYTTTTEVYDTVSHKNVERPITISFTTKLLYNKSTLALLATVNNGDRSSEEVVLMFKKDTPVPATIADIQGNWYWYMDGDSTDTRAAFKIEQNRMIIVIVAWGQRYDGTFTYENGLINFNVEAQYTSRGNPQGEGWGRGALDPETLEANWEPLNPDSWLSYDFEQMPFVANGNEAYGTIANLTGVYYKK
jgi:hypothetical protein